MNEVYSNSLNNTNPRSPQIMKISQLKIHNKQKSVIQKPKYNSHSQIISNNNNKDLQNNNNYYDSNKKFIARVGPSPVLINNRPATSELSQCRPTSQFNNSNNIRFSNINITNGYGIGHQPNSFVINQKFNTYDMKQQSNRYNTEQHQKRYFMEQDYIEQQLNPYDMVQKSNGYDNEQQPNLYNEQWHNPIKTGQESNNYTIAQQYVVSNRPRMWVNKKQFSSWSQPANCQQKGHSNYNISNNFDFVKNNINEAPTTNFVDRPNCQISNIRLQNSYNNLMAQKSKLEWNEENGYAHKIKPTNYEKKKEFTNYNASNNFEFVESNLNEAQKANLFDKPSRLNLNMTQLTGSNNFIPQKSNDEWDEEIEFIQNIRPSRLTQNRVLNCNTQNNSHNVFNEYNKINNYSQKDKRIQNFWTQSYMSKSDEAMLEEVLEPAHENELLNSHIDSYQHDSRNEQYNVSNQPIEYYQDVSTNWNDDQTMNSNCDMTDEIYLSNINNRNSYQVNVNNFESPFEQSITHNRSHLINSKCTFKGKENFCNEVKVKKNSNYVNSSFSGNITNNLSTKSKSNFTIENLKKNSDLSNNNSIVLTDKNSLNRYNKKNSANCQTITLDKKCLKRKQDQIAVTNLKFNETASWRVITCRISNFQNIKPSLECFYQIFGNLEVVKIDEEKSVGYFKITEDGHSLNCSINCADRPFPSELNGVLIRAIGQKRSIDKFVCFSIRTILDVDQYSKTN